MLSLKYLRGERTRRSNRVRASIDYMLRAEAKWDLGGNLITNPSTFQGLPSWWPFWSDVLKDNTRQLVRAARELAAAEGIEEAA